MSYHTADRNPTVPHGTLVYDSKANAKCFNTRGLVKNPQAGRSYWINEEGLVQEVIAADKGILKYKQQPSPQSAPPFAAIACASG